MLDAHTAFNSNFTLSSMQLRHTSNFFRPPPLMKLKVALDYSMSVWMFPGVKSSKMTHWRGIYRQLTRIEPLEKKLLENCVAPVNPTYLQQSSSV